MIKQLLNSVFAKYRDLSVSDKSRYFSQPRPIIVNSFVSNGYYGMLREQIYTNLPPEYP